MSSRLIFAEIVGGLATLCQGGTFICKFFDIINQLTVDFLYLLQCKFKTLYIYKPKTSRMANSEKYIICQGYLGINSIELENLISIAESWPQSYADEKQQVIALFEPGVCPIGFVNFIEKISSKIIEKQVANIEETVCLMKKLNKGNDINIASIIKQQKQNAQSWCRENHMPIKIY
jgi:hypothetical protein